jgi:tetratricopeptide (TPR) repeat protein
MGGSVADAFYNLNHTEQCLAMIAAGTGALYNGNDRTAEGSFQIGLMLAKRAPDKERSDLQALALCHLSLLRKRQGRVDEARQFREQVKPRFEDGTPFMPIALFHHLMASALMELAEYQQAIPFWEQAVVSKRNDTAPTAIANDLWRLGECYSRVGLKDHAVIPLRPAVKVFRNSAGDPRLSAALLTLGNALRKSQPAEAERCYREVADLHLARGQFLSATPAWNNIGILCSVQGRYDESLELFRRVLEIREKTPGTPLARIASALNNVASCYRRMGKFSNAHESVGLAIELLREQGGSELASSYGTRGLIYKDEGHDGNAIEWLQRAYAEHQKAPSPKLDSIAEDLENEIAVLKRLGKAEEAILAESRLEAVRTKMKALAEASGNLGAIDDLTSQCALLIELNFDRWADSAQRKQNCAELARRLAIPIEDEGIGSYGGSATIPESTTLIFYGPDAEALFDILEPYLMAEAICSGSRITIRQQDRFREVVLPTRGN